MTAYRLYLFDGRRERGERVTRSLPLAGAREDEAIREADALREGRYAEVWRRDDLLRVFEAD